jgi:predicted GIY-YIG superfamily endonuclease
MADYIYIIELNNGTTYRYEGNDEMVERHIKANEGMGAKVVSKNKVSKL